MKIAIVRRNGLGDLLCAYPLILYIQKNFKNPVITLFVDSRNAPLLPYLPSIDHSVIFREKGNKYWRFYKTAAPYKKQFDLAISAKTSPMKLNNCFLYWLKAKERIAYVEDNWHGRLINRPIFYNPREAQKAHQALKCLRTIAPHLNEVPREYYPTATIPDAIKGLYPQPVSKGVVLLLSATSTLESNRFETLRYTHLLNRLYKEFRSPFSLWDKNKMRGGQWRWPLS